MPLAYSPAFIGNVVVGFVVTVIGAVLALVAAVWYMRAREWAGNAPRPLAFRALSVAAVLLFVVGIAWQLKGYLRLEYRGFFLP